MWEQIFQIALPAIVGAATAGVPLYIQLRKVNAEIKQTSANAELDVQKKAQEMSNTATINKEAEWKRILEEKDKELARIKEEKDAELVRLRAKDDEQEAKLNDLLNRHIECKQNEARQDERAKFYEKRSEEQGRELKALASKVVQLESLVRKIPNATDSGSATPPTPSAPAQ